MNKLKIFFSDHLGVGIIASAALCILAIGSVLAATTLILTYDAEQLYLQKFCLDNNCVKAWLEYNSSVFKILEATGALIAGLVTIGGILVAVASYQNSVKTPT